MIRQTFQVIQNCASVKIRNRLPNLMGSP